MVLFNLGGWEMRPYRFLVLGYLFFFIASGDAAENQCITCHETLLPSTQRAHDFAEWRNSVHARNGVTCEQCHGGNPATSDMKQAHTGVIRSTQPTSPLYFNRIADACGKCHAEETAEYKKSFHAKELGRAGRGPNCTTCHGSMATRILNPQELEQTCSLCHSLRPVASEALVTLNQAGAALAHWKEAAANAKKRGQWTQEQTSTLAAAEQKYQTVQRKWHSLDMQTVITQSRQIITAAKQAVQALKLKTGTTP